MIQLLTCDGPSGEESLSWSMHGDPPDVSKATVSSWDEAGDYDRPLSHAELDAEAYSDGGTWELHMEFDERAVKDHSLSQLADFARRCQHGSEYDIAVTSSIQMVDAVLAVGVVAEQEPATGL
jgi:hypothetical protein